MVVVVTIMLGHNGAHTLVISLFIIVVTECYDFHPQDK